VEPPYVVVTVDFAVTVLVLVETTNTNPAHRTAFGYAAGEKIGLPFENLHVLICFEARSESSGADRARLGGASAGATPLAPGSVDLMGWKPAVVAVTMGARLAVVSIVIDSVLASVTVLEIL
jgi:hypothetical protein